jgi:hypothetical protein
MPIAVPAMAAVATQHEVAQRPADGKPPIIADLVDIWAKGYASGQRKTPGLTGPNNSRSIRNHARCGEASFSSARTTNRFPSSRCASATKLVRPSESRTEPQPQLQPAFAEIVSDEAGNVIETHEHKGDFKDW